jgi:hypothetical protein
MIFSLTISGLVEAVSGVAVACKDNDPVATVLKSHCGVDDESFGSSNAEIRVKKGDGFAPLVFRHCPNSNAFSPNPVELLRVGG